jgi:hypothetical protein
MTVNKLILPGSLAGVPKKADRGWCWFVLALSVLMAGFLVGPRVPDDQQEVHCVVNVRVAGPWGVSLNCDSSYYMSLARDPSMLLAPRSVRQNRPGMVLAAATLAMPLSLLSDLAVLPRTLGVTVGRADMDPQRVNQALSHHFPQYAAYIALNVMLLLLSFHCFRRVCGRDGVGSDTATTMVVVSVGVLLVANDVTKAFVWSPHNQMLNIFVPVAAVAATLRSWSGGLLNRRFAAGAGLLSGFGYTAYQLFAIIPVCVIIAGLLHAGRPQCSDARSRAGINIALLLGLGVAPFALWYLFVRMATGEFYDHELSSGLGVWMINAWAHGGVAALLGGWAQHGAAMVKLAAWQAIPIGAVMAVLLMAAITQREIVCAALGPLVPVAMAGLFVSAVVVAFYASAGYTPARLAFAAIPPLIVVAGAIAVAVVQRLEAIHRRMLACGCAMIAALQVIYVIVKDGPYS